MHGNKDDSDKSSRGYRGYHRLKPSSTKPVRVTVGAPEPYDTVLNVKAEDISCTGLSFVTRIGTFLKVGDFLPFVEITLPGIAQTVKLAAEVQVVKGNTVGIAFKKYSEREQDIIAKYMAARETEIIREKDSRTEGKKILEKKKDFEIIIAKILLVEDQPIPQVIIVDLLKKSKYSVTIANDGEEGIMKAIQDPPDLILMDMNMPKMNGDEACKRIKQDPKTKDIPILMLTTSQDKTTVVRAIQAGADDYIIKSGEHLPILKKIKSALIKKGVIKA